MYAKTKTFIFSVHFKPLILYSSKMNVPRDLLYSKTHEWIRREPSDETTVTVGITDHAQAELTDIVFVELPKIGASLVASSPAAVVESVKAANEFELVKFSSFNFVKHLTSNFSR